MIPTKAFDINFFFHIFKCVILLLQTKNVNITNDLDQIGSILWIIGPCWIIEIRDIYNFTLWYYHGLYVYKSDCKYLGQCLIFQKICEIRLKHIARTICTEGQRDKEGNMKADTHRKDDILGQNYVFHRIFFAKPNR